MGAERARLLRLHEGLDQRAVARGRLRLPLEHERPDNRNAYRIAAVNMSIGGLRPDLLLYGGYCDSGPGDGTVNVTYLAGWINSLKAVGIATTVSSGNDNSATGTRRPSCIRNAISVGDTTLDASGRDAAAPHVAGAIAVARAFKSMPATGATVDLLQSALQCSGTAVMDSRNSITRTRIHVANLLYYV